MFIFASLVACDNPGYPGLRLSENVGSMPNHDKSERDTAGTDMGIQLKTRLEQFEAGGSE
jgi:hypothetical protein